MIFSSNVFLFLFLPIAILMYYLVLKNDISSKNMFLFFISLFFYAWGEPLYIILMLSSIYANYSMGRFISKEECKYKKKCFLVLGIIINISILFVFKYYDFFVSSINSILHCDMKLLRLSLPIGISFYTFQGLSYLIDVYRDGTKVQKNFLNVGLYIAFFPQLIAGPIVRYSDIQKQLIYRKYSVDKFSEGIERFVFGLGKKVLLANNLALVTDNAYLLLEAKQLSVLMAWLGAIAYTLQIYYDFSGYSDMAIGLGKMFGFDLPENFNYPYIAKSISEFWRRWHMTLQGWYKDYVYIPLGGSRVSKARHILNLFVVWGLTGLWHGANWTFIVWGLMYFCLITFETHVKKVNKLFAHFYTLFFVIIGWIFFRADSLLDGYRYTKSLFGCSNNILWDGNAVLYFKEYLWFFILGILIAFPIYPYIKKKCNTFIFSFVKAIIIIIVWILSISYIVRGSYNPFIYFNF